jgi:hypothetical protein
MLRRPAHMRCMLHIMSGGVVPDQTTTKRHSC